jgi:hypothetical protein
VSAPMARPRRRGEPPPASANVIDLTANGNIINLT